MCNSSAYVIKTSFRINLYIADERERESVRKRKTPPIKLHPLASDYRFCLPLSVYLYDHFTCQKYLQSSFVMYLVKERFYFRLYTNREREDEEEKVK